ncbi:MAG: carbon-nitrogen hydrolase family protein [Planctomycetota bacterium]
MPAPDRLRVAAVQYFLRPVSSFEQFAEQVRGVVAAAVEYRPHAVVLPEYFSTQLASLDDPDLPPRDLLRSIVRRADATLDLLRQLAQQHSLYLVAGTVPTPDPDDPDTVYNDCPVVSPDGRIATQGKLHLTRWELEHTGVTPRDRLRVFDTAIGKLAVNVCYDIEFPELARAAARAGCEVVFCPSCTEDRPGHLRVRYCAQARAIENQVYVVQAAAVGSLPRIPSASLHHGQSAILTPSDLPFARDGVLAECDPNAETIVVGDLDLRLLHHTREQGTVLTLRDSAGSARLAADVEAVTL